jgi:GxxExxY protein
MPETNVITSVVIDCAMKIHKDLGPGLLESVYTQILFEKIKQNQLVVEKEKPISFIYEGIPIENGFRLDLLVEDQVVVELKSVEKLSDVHFKQVLTYLKILKLRYGLLINFGAPLLKQGIHRIVNGY